MSSEEDHPELTPEQNAECAEIWRLVLENLRSKEEESSEEEFEDSDEEESTSEQLVRHRKPWTIDEDKELLRRWMRKEEDDAIGVAMGRTTLSVRQRRQWLQREKVDRYGNRTYDEFWVQVKDEFWKGVGKGEEKE